MDKKLSLDRIKTNAFKLLIITLSIMTLGGAPLNAIQQNFLNDGLEKSPTKKNRQENAGKTPLKIQLFKIETGWGYDIYRNNKLYIHQPYVPAISGNQTFKTEEDARKTGELIILKIKKNILPPTVTIAELDSLGVLLQFK